MSAQSIVILVTIGIYMLFMLWLGNRMSKRLSGLDDYFLAGRNLPWFVLTMTFAATVANTAQLMGQPGFAYSTGFSYVFWSGIASSTIGLLLLPRIGVRLRNLNLSTISDFVYERFPGSNRLAYLVSAWQVVWAVFVTALSLFGASLLVEVITGLSWTIAILIIAVVTVIYTISGGLRAVVVTDAVQMLIIILGVSILFFLLLFKYGFFTSFFSGYLGADGYTLSKAAEGFNLYAGFTDIFKLPPGMDSILGLLAFIMATSLWIPVDLGFAQRMLAARSMEEGRKGAYAFFGIDYFNNIVLVLIGVYGVIFVPGLTNTDEVVIRMVNETFPIAGAALVVSAVAAAAMSTISTYLNAGSSILVKNFMLKLKPDLAAGRQIFWSKVFTAVICLAALSFGPFISSSGIVAAAIAVQMVLVTSLAPVVILGVFWKRLTEKAAFWGCLVNSIITFILMMAAGGPFAAIGGTGFFGIPVIFWGTIVAIILFGGISLLTTYKPESMSVAFREIFEGKRAKVSNKDLVFLGSLWAVLFGLVIYHKVTGSTASFPPLSGPFAWMTDTFFILSSLGVSITAIWIIVKVVKFIREEAFDEISKPHEEERGA
ncbi:MAG: sodium:solute symporter family protein [Clostridia bacterium]